MKRCTKACAYKKRHAFHKCFCTHLLLQKCLWTGIFFERRLVHTDSDASKHRCLCTEVSTHIYTHDFTQKTLYTQEVSTHRSSHFRTASFDAPKALTHNSIYTQNLRDAFTCRLCYKRKIYTESCCMFLHTGAITHRRFYIQKLLHTGAFAHRCFYMQKPFHTSAFKHRCFPRRTHSHTRF
jgi:hypothetical protein